MSTKAENCAVEENKQMRSPCNAVITLHPSVYARKQVLHQFCILLIQFLHFPPCSSLSAQGKITTLCGYCSLKEKSPSLEEEEEPHGQTAQGVSQTEASPLNCQTSHWWSWHWIRALGKACIWKHWLPLPVISSAAGIPAFTSQCVPGPLLPSKRASFQFYKFRICSLSQFSVSYYDTFQSFHNSKLLTVFWVLFYISMFLKVWLLHQQFQHHWGIVINANSWHSSHPLCAKV